MQTPRILLTGAEGQVGWELQKVLATLGEVTACTRHQLDITDKDMIRKLVSSLRPDLIVNAAAYTAVDKAEHQPEIADAVNRIGPSVLADAAGSVDAAVLHFSTDFVFDGRALRPYLESDVTNPLGIYGRTKLAGEKALMESRVPSLIIRTAWVYGLRGNNFLTTIRKLAKTKASLRIVNDQTGTPTSAPLLAQATGQILATMKGEYRDHLSNIGGIYHLACSGQATWFEFAKHILESEPSDASRPELEPVRTEDYPTDATRPAYSVLDCSLAQQVFGVHLPDWKSALRLVIGPPLAH